MSKARQLANLLSNSADLSDGASTGGEFKFTASGAIEVNKALIKKSDETVEQIKFSTATVSSALTSATSIDSLNSYQKLLDILLDGDYLWVVLEETTGTYLNTIRVTLYSIDSNNQIAQEQSSLYSQSWNRTSVGHRAWITKTSTANKYVLTIFDSDESVGDGRLSFYGIVNNLNGSFSSSIRVQTIDASSISYPKSGFRPVQMGNYIVSGITGDSTSEYVYAYSLRTDYSGTTVALVDSGEIGTFPNGYDDNGYPHQRVIVKRSDTVCRAVMSTSSGALVQEYFGLSQSTGAVSDGGSSIISLAGSLLTSVYTEFDMVWSDTLNYYLLVTNNATDTRVAIYDDSLNFVHARDYPNVGKNDEFYRSLQVDENTGRFYLITHNNTSGVATFITGTVSNNKVYFFEDETITYTPTSQTSDGRPMLCIDETNGKIAYSFETKGETSTNVDEVYVGLVSPATTSSSNINNGTFIGYSKEAVSNGEYVTVAIDGGTVSLSGLTVDTTYFVEDDGGLNTSGDVSKCVGKALTSTDLRVDTLASSIVTTDSNGNIPLLDNDRIYFGTDNDAYAYHDGTNFWLVNENSTGGTARLEAQGQAQIQGSSIILETTTGENALYYNGQTLYGYYDGNAKFQTDSGGLVVTGYVYPTSGIAHSGDTNNRIIFGTDTQTYQTGGFNRMNINSTGLISMYNNVEVGGELIAGSYNESYAAVTSTTNATTVNCEVGNSFSHTLTENTTFTFSNPPANNTAYSMSIEIIQDALASGFTVTWPTSVDWPSATAPTLTATASAKDVFVFTTRDGGTTWYGFTAGQNLG